MYQELCKRGQIFFYIGCCLHQLRLLGDHMRSLTFVFRILDKVVIALADVEGKKEDDLEDLTW